MGDDGLVGDPGESGVSGFPGQPVSPITICACVQNATSLMYIMANIVDK